MMATLRAEGIRLWSVRTTAVLTVLLLTACVGPIILMAILYDVDYQGPIDAGDLGKCVSIVHVLAIVFVGSHTATEIRTGAFTTSFLTQGKRWPPLLAQYAVASLHLITCYVAGLALATTAAIFVYPDGLDMSARGRLYLGAYLVVVLAWCAITMSLAVLTRSAAASIAGPLTWMLLLEQLISVVPMLDGVVPWLPFTAGLDILASILRESADGIPWARGLLALACPTVALAAAALFTHIYRDAPQ